MNANPLDPTRSYLPQIHSTPGTGQYQFHPATLDVASLKGSRASLLNEVRLDIFSVFTALVCTSWSVMHTVFLLIRVPSLVVGPPPPEMA